MMTLTYVQYIYECKNMKIENIDDKTLLKITNVSLTLFMLLEICLVCSIFFAILYLFGQIYADIFLFIAYVYSLKTSIDTQRSIIIDETLKVKQQIIEMKKDEENGIEKDKDLEDEKS